MEQRQRSCQLRDPSRGDFPDQRVVDLRVAVHQDVAEGDDAGEVRNPIRGAWIDLAEPIERLADDLKLSPDRRAKHDVLSVVVPARTRYELNDATCRFVWRPRSAPATRSAKNSPARSNNPAYVVPCSWGKISAYEGEKQVLELRHGQRRGQDWIGPEFGRASRTVSAILRRQQSPTCECAIR